MRVIIIRCIGAAVTIYCVSQVRIPAGAAACDCVQVVIVRLSVANFGYV